VAQAPHTRVLIVEDNADTRDALEQMLRLRGYETVTADDGLDALTYLRGGGGASLILLDMRMPNMDGAALQRALKSDPRWAEIPVVILSAFPPDDPGDAVAVLRKGAFDPEDLLSVVERSRAK